MRSFTETDWRRFFIAITVHQAPFLKGDEGELLPRSSCFSTYPLTCLPVPAALPHSILSLFRIFTLLGRRGRPAAGWLLALLLLGGAPVALAQAPAASPECAADEKFANTW